jgi:peptide/nickel transport system permease protein
MLDRIYQTFGLLLRQRDMKLITGGAIILVIVAAAILAPLIAPHDPLELNNDDRLHSPSGKYLLGTDQLGRDTFSRVMFGARTSLMVGMISVGAALIIGTSLGILAGYYGGFIDDVVMRTADVIFAFPAIILALVIISILGASLVNVIIAITLFTTPGIARLARGLTLSAKEQLYVEAARAMGMNPLRIMRRAILPNIAPPLIVVATLQIPGAIIAEAGLSFLGLGTPPPAATWGSMLSRSRVFMQTAPWMTLAPGIAIMLVIIGFALFGDSLRDIFDPRSQSRRSQK